MSIQPVSSSSQAIYAAQASSTDKAPAAPAPTPVQSSQAVDNDGDHDGGRIDVKA